MLCPPDLCSGSFLQPAREQQDSSQVATNYRLTLIDGSEIIGTILKEDSLQVEFESNSKVMMLVPRSQIKAIGRLAGSVVDEESRRSDSNYTRLWHQARFGNLEPALD
jgi:hypothetical protein